ncbi:hypothetical protein N7462_003516 [Penicillium macrosclerotiorum]|uniref:uncharacterized protein n=1 Tax=Penicillium macrosclerotiorum TaxID=303699 RepID=UPI0025480BFF|nr:uncharacterized protein N7462_003516 [Penicillium macrosclerotiorum]KAJ5689124.1 hypothetical protein N7462_003516 [Penicillium macrosclerotiorum]
MFLNTTTTDLEIHFNSVGTKIDRLAATSPRAGLLSPSLSVIPRSGQRPEYDPVLMSYFEHVICSSSTLVDNAHYNPYRYLILPMALESEGLYHATLAIAANTLRLSDPRYRLPALEHHHLALSHLRGLLNYDTWEEKELDEMLGLVLMLCWFDISDNSRPSWVTHLNGFQDLIRTRQNRPGRSDHSKELSSFFNRYFAFHLVLARTAFKVNPETCQAYVLPDTLLETPDTIDPYMGFSPSLLLLINQVTELAGHNERDQQVMGAQRVYDLKRRLEEIQQKLPSEQIDPDTECASIAEANRLGALLLLHETCSSKAGSASSTQLPSLDSKEKSQYVDQILKLILTKKSNMMRTAVLPLWPLFLAGCCAREEEERVIVLQLFGELESIRRFGNITPAMEVVEMVWRQQDLAGSDDRRPQKNGSPDLENDPLQGARFAWEHAMAMLGDWKVSLT